MFALGTMASKAVRVLDRNARRLGKTAAVLTALAATSPALASTVNLPLALTFQVRQSTLANSGPQAALNEFFMAAKTVGGTVLFLTDWSSPDNFAGLAQNIRFARAAGLEVAIAVQVNDALNRTIGAPSGYAPTFANSDTARLYLNNIGALASLKPKYMILNEEVNLLYELNRTEYNNYKYIYPLAYQVAKSVSPNTLYGVAMSDGPWNSNPAEKGIPSELGPHDLIGITSYPYNDFRTVSQIPSDYYSRWRLAYPNDPLVFAELDWDTGAKSSLSEQAQFVSELPQLMQGVDPALITWALPFDCNCFSTSMLTQSQIDFFLNQYNVDLAALFDTFNNEGLIDVNGNPKPGWTALMNLTAGVVPANAPAANFMASRFASAASTPEPSTWAMFLVGGALLAGVKAFVRKNRGRVAAGQA